jgi:3-methylcrotonyl-CoA carboxylase alpha subunit
VGGRLGLEKRVKRMRLRLEEGARAREFDVSLDDQAAPEEEAGELRAVRLRGKRFPVRAVRSGERIFVWCLGQTFEFTVAAPGPRRSGAGEEAGLLAPMPGKILKSFVHEGDAVRKGESLLVLEAMKMEHEIRSPRPGVIRRLPFREGDQVEAGVRLVEFAG